MQPEATLVPLIVLPVPNITVRLSSLPPTTFNHKLSKKLWLCSGELQEPESPEEPGRKRDSPPTQRILEPSFGVGTAVKKTLLSMNSEVESTSAICCDGWTDIQSLLKPRVAPLFLGPVGCGSRPTYIPKIGIQPSTQQLLQRYCDV